MSLTKKINLIVFFGLFFSFIISLSVSFFVLKKITYKKFYQKIYLIGNELSKTCTISLLLHDIDLIKNRVESYTNDKDIYGIYIFDKNGKVIYSTGKKSKKFIEIPIIIKFNLNFSDKRSKKILGKLKIFYTENYFEKEILKILIILTIVLLIALGSIATIIYYVLEKALNKPIKNLMNLIYEIKKGNFSIKVNFTGSPEILELANTFKDLAETLEQKNKELKRSYEIMAEQKTLAELGKFAMIIAHEIKNPLGIIKGACQVYRKDNIPEETKAEMLDYIEEEVKRLDLLVKDFMAISKVKNPVLITINIKDFLFNLVEKIKLMYPDVKIILKFKCNSIYKKIDTEIFTQIITNLIKNSIEASADKILITCNDNDKIWCISIEDNGCGISNEELEKIFEPFYTKKDKGTGLGLSIVNNYVKLLNGEIEVKSKLNEGTEIKICFLEDN